MTLLETERLIRKLAEVLQRGGNPEALAKLAGDYVAACQAANLRLQQCEAMIKAGDRPQAIQLAETPPNLLDWVTVLEFQGADEWRAYCQQNGLPMADRIDERSVAALNGCYALGITTDHPLYGAYRKAMLSRNDEQALKILHSITRLNPSDTNAAAELTRLDGKVLVMKLQHLGSSLEGTDPALVVAEMEAIEGFGFKAAPAGEIWRRAQVIRCEYFLQEAGKSRNAGDWREARSRLDAVGKIVEAMKLELPAAAQRQREEIEGWTRGEEEKNRRDREFQGLLGQLQQRIAQSEEKDTSARYVELPELRDDFEGLNRVWRALAEFTRPIPEALTAQFRKRAALLEGEIERRTAIRRRLILGVTAAVLVVGVGIVWLALAQARARDFTKHLREAVAQRQVRAAEKLLEEAQGGKAGDASAVAEAETFSKREHGLLDNFEAAFGRLPTELTGDPDAGRLGALADQLAQARTAFEAMAPDLKKENEPKLQAYEKTWQAYLAESGTKVNALYEEWVEGAEKESGGLDYRAPLEKTAAQLVELEGTLQKIGDCEAGFTNRLNLRDDLMDRAAVVRSKYAAYAGEVTKLQQSLTAAQRARTLKEFNDAMGVIAASEFSTTPVVVAAAQVQSLNASEESTLRWWLGMNEAATWAFLTGSHPAGFVPGSVMPSESLILDDLEKNPVVNGHLSRYRLHLDGGRPDGDEWITREPFEPTKGKLTQNVLTGVITERTYDSRQIQAWAEAESPDTVVFQTYDYTYFNHHLVITNVQTVTSFEQLDDPKEMAAYADAGLEEVKGGDAYHQPLLPVLDAIKDSKEGSPLFRAYLYERLIALMGSQPEAWGLAFCPATRADEVRLVGVTGRPINSGDWLVAAKAQAESQRLEAFFAAARVVSYAKQAEGLLAVERAVAADGMKYAGYAGLDGKPALTDGVHAGEIYGFNADGKPVRVPSGIASTDSLMPLSPLFDLAKPASAYLSEAGINPADVNFKDALPPLFNGRAGR